MDSDELLLHTIDISHRRLPQLMKLADSAEAFYRWVETKIRKTLNKTTTLSAILLVANRDELIRAISSCYTPTAQDKPIPSLYDGGGRAYPHSTACYYMFSWLLRDAPQQRLAPLIAKAKKEAKATTSAAKLGVEVTALAELFLRYRTILGTFEWPSIREVACDRLEGSRRSIQGHATEIAIRTSFIGAVEKYYNEKGNYGVFEEVEIADKQIKLGNETFDVSAKLTHSVPAKSCMILVPVKSRETEGGGHAHIFTRDINSAIDVSKQGTNNYVIAFIIAQNWAAREQEHVTAICDLAVIIKANPNNFEAVPPDKQAELDAFIEKVLDGSVEPKTWEAIRGIIEKVKE